MNSTQIGYIGETMAKLELAKLGFDIFSPESNSSEYDFIAVRDGKMYPIQVKSSFEPKDGNSYAFDFRRTPARGTKKVEYSTNPIFIIVAISNNFVGIVKGNPTSLNVNFAEKPRANANHYLNYILTLERFEAITQ